MSAFRDKLEHWNGVPKEKNFYYTRYGKSIVSKYRGEARRRFGKDFFSKANNYGAPVAVTRGKRTAELPIFWEFVQFVKRSSASRMDEHWNPVYRWQRNSAASRKIIILIVIIVIIMLRSTLQLFTDRNSYCSPCSVMYETVIHFEHLHPHEGRFLGEILAPEPNRTLPAERWDNRNTAGLSDEEITAIYFGQLDEQDVKDLYRMYEKDFLLFGYSFTYKGKRFPEPAAVDLVHLL